MKNAVAGVAIAMLSSTRQMFSLVTSYIEPEGYHQSECAAVRRQTAVACEVPVAVSGELDGQEHLYEVFPRGEIYVGLIEQTVPKACSDEYSDEAVEEQRVEQFVLYLLFLIQPSYYEIGQDKSDEPAERIPVHGEASYAERRVVRVPQYV